MGAAFCVYANLAADRSGFNAFGRKKFQGRGDLGVFSHQIQQQVSFFTGGDFRPEKCIACGLCLQACPMRAIRQGMVAPAAQETPEA